MTRPTVLLRAVAVLFLSALASPASAQTATDLVGTWAVVSVDTVSPDGKRTPAFGPNPQGVVTLDGNGRYVKVVIMAISADPLLTDLRSAVVAGLIRDVVRWVSAAAR